MRTRNWLPHVAVKLLEPQGLQFGWIIPRVHARLIHNSDRWINKTGNYFTTWWHGGIEILSILLALCEGNPLLTGVFLSQYREYFVCAGQLLRCSYCQWSNPEGCTWLDVLCISGKFNNLIFSDTGLCYIHHLLFTTSDQHNYFPHFKVLYKKWFWALLRWAYVSLFMRKGWKMYAQERTLCSQSCL